MNRIQRILVATDCSEHARRAETRAAMLGFQLRAGTVEIMTVMPEPVRHGVNDDLRLAERRAPGGEESRQPTPAAQANGLTLMRSVRSGDPASAILSRAAEMQADLTVVAGLGRDERAERCVGWHHELVCRTEGPLLLVNCEPGSAYRRILVAVDFTPACGEAARFAMEMAPAAFFTFVHAYRMKHENLMYEAGVPEHAINGVREHGCDTARAMLKDFVAGLGKKKVLAAHAVEAGHPARIIGDMAKRTGAELVVIGKSESRDAGVLFPGSVTLRLAAGRDADLLVVPAPVLDDWFDRPAA